MSFVVVRTEGFLNGTSGGGAPQGLTYGGVGDELFVPGSGLNDYYELYGNWGNDVLIGGNTAFTDHLEGDADNDILMGSMADVSPAAINAFAASGSLPIEYV